MPRRCAVAGVVRGFGGNGAGEGRETDAVSPCVLDFSRLELKGIVVRILHFCFFVAAVLSAAIIHAAGGLPDADSVPHLKERGRTAYAQFWSSEFHRAFAIAPGGAWSWAAQAGSADEAAKGALEACAKQTPQRCVLYAVDEKIVFDAKAWPTLWGPYKSPAAAARAAVGVKPGERFPDVAFKDTTGKRRTLKDWKGKVVVVHFWGSWCSPCRREMPDLQALRESLKDRSDVAFVLLQAREPFPVSRTWAEKQGLRLPLFDSGSTGETDAAFTLGDGSRVADRTLAAQFPSTYVVDKSGVVVFSHAGAVPKWAEYADFLRDAAEKSGR